MKKPYDPKDNDTYEEVLNNSPVLDVELHMFKNPNGNSTINNIRGHFSIESKIAAKNNVLHFPSVSKENPSLKLLKYLDVETLFPLSLIERYNISLMNASYTQKTPIYYLIEKEKFAIPLDYRFFRDLKTKYPEEKRFHTLPNEDFLITKDAQSETLFMLYDNLESIKKAKSFLYIEDLYKTFLLEKSNTEDVIIINYSLEENEPIYFKPKHNSFNSLEKCTQNSKLSFEFIKAKIIDKQRYAIYDKEGKLNVKSSIYINKERIQKENSQLTANLSFLLYSKKDLLVVPYSDESFLFLEQLSLNMQTLFNDLNKLLLKQKQNSGLDQPLSLISNDTLLLLESNSKKTIKGTP